MDPKSILAVMPEMAQSPIPALVAVDIARRFDGYADCLMLGEDSSSYATLPSHAGTPGQLAAAQAAQERRAQEREARAEALRSTLTRVCSAAGVAIYDYDEARANGGIAPPAVTMRSLGGNARAAAKCAQACDLVVMPCPETSQTREIVEAALFESGRPVLISPKEQRSDIGRHIVIGWDRSAQAWHAVSSALPFMEEAQDVTVAMVGSNGIGQESTKELLDYLRRHGIAANAYLTAPSGSVGETLLKLAEDKDADLLVMGGYSHSRLREALIGGATRHVLTHPTSTPVLMVH